MLSSGERTTQILQYNQYQDEASITCVPHLCTDHLLDEGVVGGVHTGAQRIKTLSITVVG